MKKIFAILTILILISQPLYGLGPASEDWGAGREEDVAAIATALCEKRPEEDGEVRRRITRQFRAVDKAVPQWETLEREKDGSVEIAIVYTTKTGEDSSAVVRAVRVDDTGYKLERIGDRKIANSRIVRGTLGLNLSRVSVPAGTMEEGKIPGLPQAQAFAYRNAVVEKGPIQEVLSVIEEVKRRMGTPISAVVVFGMSGQSLGNRAVVQMLGSQEVKFIFPDNIANPNRWLAELTGINPNAVLLYVSSKTGDTDETMANFWFFLEWLIQKLDTQGVASSLIKRLQATDLTKVKLNELVALGEEKALLQATLNRIVISTTPEKNGPIYTFAVNNEIPIVPLQAPVEGRYAVLFRSGQFTTTLAGYDLEKMRQAVVPLASAFKEDNPELNPALETAMYAYALGRLGKPILAAVSSDKRLIPLFEWTRQLVNESLGREDKGPYLTFAAGEEASRDLMSAPKDKLFLVINVGKEKMRIPEGVSAIEINIPEINEETLARVFLFLEEFTVRYGTLLGVNPVGQPWAGEFGTSEEVRKETGERNELTIQGGPKISASLEAHLLTLTKGDQELLTPIKVPESEQEFDEDLLNKGNYRQPEEIETVAQNLALQLYVARRSGKSVNPFFIYSASPEAELLGRFIKYMGQNRIARLTREEKDILWDYLIGTTDQHSVIQQLRTSTRAITTFIHFLQEPEPNPPTITVKGLIHERLVGKTPHEVSTLNLQSVRQMLIDEGRLTNTIEVPKEEEQNLGKLYQLLVRTWELYLRLSEKEISLEGLETLTADNQSVVINTKTGVTAGDYGRELPRNTRDLWITALMETSGIPIKRFINPQAEEKAKRDLRRKTSPAHGVLGNFIQRLDVLAWTISRIANAKRSSLNRLANAEELKEKAKQEFYAFKLEDVIADVEIGSEVDDLYREISIKTANTMVAKTVQEIKRVNPKAKVIVYSKNLKKWEINAALDAVDASGDIDNGGLFDLVVNGDTGTVLAEITDKNWTKTQNEAREKTIFASRETLKNQKSVIVPKEGFIPFPELVTVMQAMFRDADTEGKLPEEVIERIASSYSVWLELAGFNRDEITHYIEEMENKLREGVNFIVSLPLPPTPRAGSVIQQLDNKYKEASETKSFA